MPWKFNPFTGNFDYYEALPTGNSGYDCFEFDGDGDLMPSNIVSADAEFETDGYGGLMPKA